MPLQYLKQIRLVYNIFLQLLNTRLILLWMMISNWFLMYVYRLITWYRKLGKQQQLFAIREGVNEIGLTVVNTSLNLYRDGFQEVGEVKCLETTPAKDEIAYCESVEDVGSSTSIPSSSTSDLGPSMSWDDIGHSHTYMDITNTFSSWTSWCNAPGSSTSTLGPSTS